MSITRTTWTDSTGSPTSGTVLNNAALQAIYDAIENNWLTNSYTPALTGSVTNPSPSSSTGAYLKIGKRCDFRATFTMSATLGSGSYFCSLPFTATTGVGVISAFAIDVSAGGAIYNGRGFIDIAAPTRLILLTCDALLATNWGPGASLPIPTTGFGSGDIIHIFGTMFTT